MLLVETDVMDSAIHGKGLFARQDIPKGTKVWEFNPVFDILVDESKIPELPPIAQDFLKFYAYRSVETNELIVNVDLSKHMNHSDTPNLVSDEMSNYFAVDDIPAGTELTCDYRVFHQDGTTDFSE